MEAVGDRALAHVPKWYAEAFLSWAANIPLVRWVDQRETFEFYNSVASQGMQSPTYVGNPIWWRGLTGKGQVVGCADTVWFVCLFFRSWSRSRCVYFDVCDVHEHVVLACFY